jgi:TRAP-type C4-dicarboxylate transport system substrate-binding protein
MSITSAQELATFFPEFSIFATGYVHQDAAHQVAVFNDPLMDPFKQKVEDELGVKLLAVMYLGRRHVNLRQSKDELTVMTPADLAGVNLRMPGTDAWQFLGKALGANPTPMAFTEVYTALSTGSVDGQDNPLPTVVDSKFYEVTNQIALTSHLVDLNYVAFSKGCVGQLTPEQQATVPKAAEDAAESGRQAQFRKKRIWWLSCARRAWKSTSLIWRPSGPMFRRNMSAPNLPRAGPKGCSTRSTRWATDHVQSPTARWSRI